MPGLSSSARRYASTASAQRPMPLNLFPSSSWARFFGCSPVGSCPVQVVAKVSRNPTTRNCFVANLILVRFLNPFWKLGSSCNAARSLTTYYRFDGLAYLLTSLDEADAFALVVEGVR